MTHLFQHLRQRTGIIAPDFSEGAGTCMKKAELLAQINQHDKTNFEYLAERASLWRLLQRAQRSQLDAVLRQETRTDEANHARVQLIKETLWMATLLEELHARLNEASTAEFFRTEQAQLRELLNTYDATYTLEHPVESPHETNHISDYLEYFHRGVTYNFDTTRLYLGHMRRIGVALIAAPQVFGHGYFGVDAFATIMAPILSVASLIVYLPRTLSNIVILMERLVENNQDIELKHRFMAHCELNDRLFNLVNDSPSVVAAVLAWFVLSGAGLAWVAYITVMVKFAEVIFASTRAYFEVTRFDALHDKYHAFEPRTLEDNHYLKHLDRNIALEKGRFIATATQHGLLLFCLASFTPPLMALSPWVPIVAALGAMLVLCLRFPNFRDGCINYLSKNSFFQPTAQEPPESHETSLTRPDSPVSI
ncbi:MAG: hypothetical protein P1U39_03290 [Legionellaceae bacterium]|nr:hypothetical protein [Legionellaceae bacterium]